MDYIKNTIQEMEKKEDINQRNLLPGSEVSSNVLNTEQGHLIDDYGHSVRLSATGCTLIGLELYHTETGVRRLKFQGAA